jgi:PAN domain
MYLRSLIFASAFVITFSGIAGTAPAQGENFSRNIDRPGNDFRTVPLRGNAQSCQRLCNANSECRAWTFVKPGIQGVNARCWLKNVIPAAVANSCCTSGVIRRNL